MAKTKKKAPSLDAKIDHLTVVVERGFAAVAEDATEMRTQITDLRTDMNTRFVAIEERLYSIEQELRDIKRRLDVIEEATSGMKGYAKELDELRTRIKEIEKHLKLKHKVSA